MLPYQAEVIVCGLLCRQVLITCDVHTHKNNTPFWRSIGIKILNPLQGRFRGVELGQRGLPESG
jgi:hypothetical protein